MESFSLHLASREILDFVLNDFSRIYVKMVRNRVSPWNSGAGKKPAQATMNHVMERLLKLMAPFAPFISEKMHKELFGSSVHLAEWPKPEVGMIDSRLEAMMASTMDALEKLQALRQEKGIKLRWPLEFAEVPGSSSIIAPVVMELGNVAEVREGREFRLGEPDMELALLREVARKVQSLRKEAGMSFGEAIALELDADEATRKRLENLKSELMKAVGARSVKFSKIGKPMGSIGFGGANIGISFRKK